MTSNEEIEKKVDGLEKCFGFPTNHKLIKRYVEAALTDIWNLAVKRAEECEPENVREYASGDDGFNWARADMKRAIRTLKITRVDEES